MPWTNYHTNLGSEVRVKDTGAIQIHLDWFEEDHACIDCEPDIDATSATGFTELIWRCEECGGGSNHLHPSR